MNPHANLNKNGPKVIAWEVTRRCSLRCKHCRGSARDTNFSNELSTSECFRIIDEITDIVTPVLILTGGEPMVREDIYDIADYATKKRMRVVMAPCGHLITPETAKKLKDAGIKCISISLDGATAKTHDAFRGVESAFEKTLVGLQHAKDAGISFQINTTVSKHNVDELEEIFNLAVELGAITFDIFLLVPTGRGSALKHLELSPEIYETTLNRIAEIADTAPIRVKTTCAPHYSRIQRQREKKTNAYMGNGCMAGREFVFISHRGIVQPCGFLDLPCGNLRENTFKEVYEKSEVFLNLRKIDDYNGKCGVCEFRFVCGGCRARSYAHCGDYLAEEPFCVYQPVIPRKKIVLLEV